MCSDAHSITLNEAAVIFKIHFLLLRFIFNTQVKNSTHSISKYQELLVVKKTIQHTHFDKIQVSTWFMISLYSV